MISVMLVNKLILTALIMGFVVMAIVTHVEDSNYPNRNDDIQ